MSKTKETTPSVSGMSMGATIVDWLDSLNSFGKVISFTHIDFLQITDEDGDREGSPVRKNECEWYHLIGRAVVDLGSLLALVGGGIALALKAFNVAFSFSVFGFPVLPLSLPLTIAVSVVMIGILVLSSLRAAKEDATDQ